MPPPGTAHRAHGCGATRLDSTEHQQRRVICVYMRTVPSTVHGSMGVYGTKLTSPGCEETSLQPGYLQLRFTLHLWWSSTAGVSVSQIATLCIFTGALQGSAGASRTVHIYRADTGRDENSIEERVLLRVQELRRWPPRLRGRGVVPAPLFLPPPSRCRGGLAPLLLQQLRQRPHLQYIVSIYS